MDWLPKLVDFAVTLLHILAALFLAYGAYLAVYWKDLRRESSEPRRESPTARLLGWLRLHVRRPHA